jgi:ribosomal subunit interface protein
MIKLRHFNDKMERIRVELDVDHNATKGMINRVEVWIYLPGQIISAGVKAEHMNEAIDLVFPKLEKQLVKIKEKKLSKIRRQR